MHIPSKPVPAEAVDLVERHGPQALLIARTSLAQARDAGDEVRAARWETLVEAIGTLLGDHESQTARNAPAG
ncbi:hypothetical protein ACLRDC_06120 [Gluconacetobacter sacchari]|uniref:hypothetical protein n=1 Tax=Gluconacetobacter sacchari TaxID=92759 RepID=UPI0039B57F58